MANDIQYNEQNLSLDEIVFENRNKDYGAYDLRFNYAKILTKSFIIGTVLFLVLALTPLIYVTIERLTAPAAKEVDSVLINIEDDLPEEEEIIEEPEDTPPPPPPQEEEPPQQEIIQNLVPEPTKAPKVETPPPPISVQTQTTTGAVSQEGVKTPSSYTPPPPPPPSTGKGNSVEVKPQVSTTEVYQTVDQEAEFTGGGLNGFRRKFQENFDNESMEGEGTVKTEITFVVERDGTISSVKATGSNTAFNKEAERTIKSIKQKWNPGKVNGQAVRSRYRFPITMQFE